jgi:hypothetical protein
MKLARLLSTLSFGIGKFYRIEFVVHEKNIGQSIVNSVIGRPHILSRSQLQKPRFLDSLLGDMEPGESRDLFVPLSVAKDLISSQQKIDTESESGGRKTLPNTFTKPGSDGDGKSPAVHDSGMEVIELDRLGSAKESLGSILSGNKLSFEASITNWDVPQHVLNGAGTGTEAGMHFMRHRCSASTNYCIDASHPLLDAARAHDLNSLKSIIASGVPVDAKEEKNGGTALHYIVSSFGNAAGNPCRKFPPRGIVESSGLNESSDDGQKCITFLVESGADVNARASNGSSPLHWAAGFGNARCVKTLLELGADPTIRTYTWGRQVFGKGSGQTAAHWAGESGHAEAVDAIVDEHPESLLFTDEREKSPADLARLELKASALTTIEKRLQEDFVCMRVTFDSGGTFVM